MEDNVVEAQDWKSTKEALTNFRRLLLCSKWYVTFYLGARDELKVAGTQGVTCILRH